ncbi:thiolase C-terminal domain-containing protein [Estrella lausannensis]|uniref:Putative 3-ketoacyl-CoA thiolase n=1 Tax=Estrella lausannensis TaxID=483423 RepID=A0A0H5DTC2_9BACT|nr:3-ketoacyl-CoA thiolase [Estrella lausannensis]CRX39069.1 Putative 3-ketoacyl-CoA thiolase [Estrella lausannensis]
MSPFSKKIYAAAGFTTVFMGSGRPEFRPGEPRRPFEDYLLETAQGTMASMGNPEFDEGVIGAFMAQRFLKQGNLPGFLPFMVPSLSGKPCFAVEGACGTGGRAIGLAIRSLLALDRDALFVSGFEMQNTVKSLYGADYLSGAAYFRKERKKGHAFFFPGIFSGKAGAYYKKWGEEKARKAMARWHEHAILCARKNPKAQEAFNQDGDPFALGMTPPNPSRFVPCLNFYDCSKVSDGAASIGLFSERGLHRAGIRQEDAVEIVGIGEAEADITIPPEDEAFLHTTKIAVDKALDQARLDRREIAVLEIHDCFTITALLSFEAAGFAKQGQAPDLIEEGRHLITGTIPTNMSGGLSGFGHPTGATGVRQLVDLEKQLTGKAANQAPLKTPYGMMISMGGNDKTVTCLIVRKGGVG